jgi:hypothetical protein
VADSNNFVQVQTLYLKGSGVGTTDTSIDIKSMKFPVSEDTVTMADFGAMGYATLEPGTAREENISFTGITQNGDGSAQLTGVTRGLDFAAPYTTVSALRQTHAGGTELVISNSAPFYNELLAKDNDETITSVYTFTSTAIPVYDVDPAFSVDQEIITKKYADDLAIAGAPDSNTTTKGLNEMATTAESQAGTDTGTTTGPLVAAPSDIAANAQNQEHTYLADSGAADAYVITLAPAITAYAAGQRFTFLATSACTGASTLNVNGLGTKDIRKSENAVVAAALVANDILAAQIVTVVYDGTQFMMDSPLGTRVTSGVSFESQTFFDDSNNVVQIDSYTTDDTWTKPTGAISVEVICVGAGGGGGGCTLQNPGGGGGGGGGAVSLGVFNASDLGATETITVGVGGAGGTADPGVAGGDGTSSSFGTWLKAGGGGGGPEGQAGANNGGGGGGAIGDGSGATGGVPSVSGADAIGGQGPTGVNTQYSAEWGGATGGGCGVSAAGADGGGSIYGAGGGGGGAGYNGGDLAGGDGGLPQAYTAGGGAAGGAAGAGANPGTAGSTNATLNAAYGGGGGGGGNGHTGNNPGAGGAGGAPGGGGGGGGAAQNVGAIGGAGAAGVVKVITHRTSV